MPGRVESPPPSPARELGELGWCELFVGLAGELGELVDHHAASRKIHAQRKCFGGEDDPHEPFCETLLHRLLECRDETCMVARDTALESIAPCAGVEHGEVGYRQATQALVGDRPDTVGLGGVGEASARPLKLLGGLVAPAPAEDEPDHRQQVVVLEMIEHVEPRRCHVRAFLPLAAIMAAPSAQIGVEAMAFAVGLAVEEGGDDVKSMPASVSHCVQIGELDRPLPFDDTSGRTSNRFDPAGELIGVRNGGRQTHQLRMGRQVEHDLFPDRSSKGVLEVVHLVHDDEGEVVEDPPLVEHVAQDLGGHHDDVGIGVDCIVAREQADPRRADPFAQVAILLVRERLDRGRVERPLAFAQRPVDRMFGNDGLAATGRSGDEDGSSGIEVLDGLQLKAVKGEVAAG